jgi:DNA-binding transcriptional MocR family regulator
MSAQTGPGYERIAGTVEEAILAGRLKAGQRLPPVRKMAQDLGVSSATVAAAYELLGRRGWTRGEVGRGTFVLGPVTSVAPAASIRRIGSLNPAVTPRPAERRALSPAAPVPWRRRAMNAFAAQIRAAHPHALDCTTGRPDAALLPLDLLQRAWHAELTQLKHEDLQYARSEPVDELVAQVLPLLAADGIRAAETNVVVGCSAQQLMMLSLDALDARLAHDSGAIPNLARRIAVEEPGFFTAYDTFERRGYELVGVAVDPEGAVPESLDAALEGGTAAVLLTPRAHNPTGASWTAPRARQLADVFARHPHVLIMEDDFSGVAAARPGSLLSDPRLADRVVHLRSFSKAIAPDLRVAVAVARGQLRAALTEAKSYADGWTSCLAQRVLARVLADPSLDAALAAALAAYAERRAVVSQVVNERLGTGAVLPAADGVNIWVRLPAGTDSAQVIQHAAACGALFAPGEPFFIRAGHREALRVNAGALTPDRAAHAATILAASALATVHTTPPALV